MNSPGTRLPVFQMFVAIVLSGATAVAAPRDRTILYENSARTAYERFSGDDMTGGELTPKRPLSFQDNNALSGEEVGHIVRNCSTTQYRCVSVWLRVFAVPRARLSPKEEYSVAGVVLKVEDCLRGDGAICQVALISADCEMMLDESCQKVTGGRERSGKPGPIVYFIYNEDVGVTTYGVADQPVKIEKDRLNVASQMILQGQRGILSDDR
jgi:hypothetical protein